MGLYCMQPLLAFVRITCAYTASVRVRALPAIWWQLQKPVRAVLRTGNIE